MIKKQDFGSDSFSRTSYVESLRPDPRMAEIEAKAAELIKQVQEKKFSVGYKGTTPIAEPEINAPYVPGNIDLSTGWAETKQALQEGLEKWGGPFSEVLEAEFKETLVEQMLEEDSVQHFGKPDNVKILIPMIRQILPGVIAHDICGVQPMGEQDGEVFKLDYWVSHTDEESSAKLEAIGINPDFLKPDKAAWKAETLIEEIKELQEDMPEDGWPEVQLDVTFEEMLKKEFKLQSPGVSVTVTDDSDYIPVGVPVGSLYNFMEGDQIVVKRFDGTNWNPLEPDEDLAYFTHNLMKGLKIPETYSPVNFFNDPVIPGEPDYCEINGLC